VKITRFEDVEAWRLARELTQEVYARSGSGSFLKDRALCVQIRAAAGSSMHNIAEGFDAGSNREFVRFLGYAQRSCTEVQSELYVALDQGYLTSSDFQDLYDRADATKRKIGGFIKYLKGADRSKSFVPEPRTKNQEHCHPIGGVSRHTT
jgi:four helix bundle protein